MKVLNLVHKENSDIDYSIFKFPDGEVQISLGEFSHKEDYINVKCRMKINYVSQEQKPTTRWQLAGMVNVCLSNYEITQGK